VAGQSYAVEVKNTGINNDIIIELYSGGINAGRKNGRSDSTVSLLKTENSNGIGEDETLVWEATQDETLLVKLADDNDNYGTDTEYDLRVVRSNMPIPGTVSGEVRSAISNAPLKGVTVEIRCMEQGQCDFDNPAPAETKEIGAYSISISGNSVLTASKADYIPYMFINNCTKTATKTTEYSLLIEDDNQGFDIDIKMKRELCVADINEDGDVTPGDALNAFNKYMEKCPTSEGFECDTVCCDVNKEDGCTPADALCIFRKYLGKPSCLD
jgi:hypothetical protein